MWAPLAWLVLVVGQAPTVAAVVTTTTSDPVTNTSAAATTTSLGFTMVPRVIIFSMPSRRWPLEGSFVLDLRESAQGYPVWRHAGRKGWLYLASNNFWSFTDTREVEELEGSTTAVVRCGQDGRRSHPDEMRCIWEYFDGERWQPDAEIAVEAAIHGEYVDVPISTPQVEQIVTKRTDATLANAAIIVAMLFCIFGMPCVVFCICRRRQRAQAIKEEEERRIRAEKNEQKLRWELSMTIGMNAVIPTDEHPRVAQEAQAAASETQIVFSLDDLLEEADAAGAAAAPADAPRPAPRRVVSLDDFMELQETSAGEGDGAEHGTVVGVVEHADPTPMVNRTLLAALPQADTKLCL